MMRSFVFLLSLLLAEPAFAEGATFMQRSQAAVSIPKGAQRVELLQLTVEADCASPAVVTEIVVKHTGLGASSDIERVYATDDVKRVSSPQSFSGRDRSAVIRPTGLSVDACASKTIGIKADFSSDAASGGEHRLIVSAVRLKDGSVIQPASAAPSSTVRTAADDVGTISVAYLPLLTSVRYGTSRTVARFTLTADGQADQVIESIVFTNEGSARDADLWNLRLMDGLILLGKAVKQMDGRTVRFDLDSRYKIGKNSTKQLTIKADVRASSKRTIRFVIQEPSDIEAKPQRRLRPNAG